MSWIWHIGPALLKTSTCSAPFKIDHPQPTQYAQFGVVAPARDGLMAVTERKPPRAVRVYDLQTRQLVRTLLPPGGYAEFGTAAAVGGGLVAVNLVDGQGAGTVQVFDGDKVKYQLANPNQKNDVTAGYPLGFGSTIDIDEGQVVVGSPSASNFTGTAYLFDLNNPQKPITLQNPKPAANDYFGAAVAIDGSNVVVGAPRKKFKLQRGGMEIEGGAVYVFDLKGKLQRTIDNPNPQDNSQLSWWLCFGSCITARDGIIALGSPGDTVDKLQAAGRAYIYNSPDDTSPETLTSPSPADSVWFGYQMAIGKSFIAINNWNRAFYASATPADILYSAGTVNVLTRKGELVCAVNNPSANNMNAFGSNSAVSADETTLVVGAWAEEVVKQGIDYEYAGAVYLYDVNLDYLLLGVNAVQMVWPVPPIPIPESHINPAAITQVATATTQAEVPPLKRGATAGGQE